MQRVLFLASFACALLGASSALSAPPSVPPPPAPLPAPPPPAPAPPVPPQGTTLPAAARGIVTIELTSGSVHVVGWARSEVDVKNTAGSGTGTQFTVHGDRAAVHATSATLEIRVPAGSAVEVRGMSADVSVQDVTGALRFDVVSGAVAVKGAPASIAARSASGKVSIEASTPQTTVRTISGDIHVRGVRGAAALESVTGTCTLSGTSFTRVEIRNTSSDVTFEGQLAAQGSFEARSHSGDVKLVLPASTSGNFELRSFSGSIESQIGSPRTGRGSLDFKAGTGAAIVRVQTFSGGIAIDVRK